MTDVDLTSAHVVGTKMDNVRMSDVVFPAEPQSSEAPAGEVVE